MELKGGLVMAPEYTAKFVDTFERPALRYAAGENFSAQADFDSGTQMLTLRSGGFDGPVLLVTFVDEIRVE